MSRRPHKWASEVASVYAKYQADRVVAEVNQGGALVEGTLRAIKRQPARPHRSRSPVQAAQGPEPVAALYEQRRVHHVGVLAELEEQCCTWTPGDRNPDRLDSLVLRADRPR